MSEAPAPPNADMIATSVLIAVAEVQKIADRQRRASIALHAARIFQEIANACR